MRFSVLYWLERKLSGCCQGSKSGRKESRVAMTSSSSSSSEEAAVPRVQLGVKLTVREMVRWDCIVVSVLLRGYFAVQLCL